MESRPLVRDLTGGGWLIGSGVIAAGLRSLLSNAAQLSVTARTAWSVISSPYPLPSTLPTDSTDEMERFRVACRTYGVTLPEQRQIQAATHRNFLFYVACAFFLAMWGLVFAPGMGWLPASIIPGLGHAAALAPSFLLGLLAARASLTNWQLRTRRLGSFSEWVRTPAAWWTTPPSEDGPGAGQVPYRRPVPRDGQAPLPLARSGRSGVATVLWATVAVAWALMPLAAYANTAGPPDLSGLFGAINTNQDTAYGLVRRIFPTLFGSTGGDTFLKDAFQSFNASLLLVASFMLSWHTVAGMVSAAHEGRLVGNKYHMIWAPVRVTAGIGLLAPVNGFCTAQMLLVQIWLLGFGLANTVWSSTVRAIVSPSGGSAVAFVPPSENAKSLLKAIVQSEACVLIVRSHPNASLTLPGGEAIAPASGPDLAGEEKIIRPAANARFSNQAASPYKGEHRWDYGPVCGAIAVAYPTPGTNNFDAEKAFSDGVTASTRDMIRSVREALGNVSAAIVATQRRSESNPDQRPITMDQARDLLLTMVEAQSAQFSGGVRDAATRYWNTVDAPARTAFLTEAEAKGWASAGVFYMTISRMSAQVIEKSNVSPDTRRVDASVLCRPNPRGGQMVGGRCDLQTQVMAVNALIDQAWDRTVQVSQISNMDSSAVTAGASGVSGFFGAIFGPLTREILQMNALDPSNPLESMVNRGHWILGTVTTGALGAYVGAHMLSKGAEGSVVGWVANKLTGAVSAIGGAVEALSPVFLLFLGAFFLFGVMNAYVLPAMPFLMWSFAVGSVVILFVESIVAASIWAFVHVRMDGQEFVDGAQRAGYMLAFNAFLRPTLSVFGLILGMAAFSAMSAFVDSAFPYAFQGAMANHFVFIIGWLVGLGMMTWLQWHFALRSFSMCHMLPDRVAAWMGASGANLGEEGEFSAAKGAFMSGAQAYGVGAVQAATQGINASRARQQRQALDQKEAGRDKEQLEATQEVAAGLKTLNTNLGNVRGGAQPTDPNNMGGETPSGGGSGGGGGTPSGGSGAKPPP